MARYPYCMVAKSSCSIKSCVDLLWMWQALHILACSLLRISEHCSPNDMGRMQRMWPVVKRPQWMASAPTYEARTYGREILGFQVLSAPRLFASKKIGAFAGFTLRGWLGPKKSEEPEGSLADCSMFSWGQEWMCSARREGDLWCTARLMM